VPITSDEDLFLKKENKKEEDDFPFVSQHVDEVTEKCQFDDRYD
jgi:hypothetical protein